MIHDQYQKDRSQDKKNPLVEKFVKFFQPNENDFNSESQKSTHPEETGRYANRNYTRASGVHPFGKIDGRRQLSSGEHLSDETQ